MAPVLKCEKSALVTHNIAFQVCKIYLKYWFECKKEKSFRIESFSYVQGSHTFLFNVPKHYFYSRKNMFNILLEGTIKEQRREKKGKIKYEIQLMLYKVYNANA